MGENRILGMVSGSDCYKRIIDYFEHYIIMRASDTLIKLMGILKRTKNRKLVSNAMILVLSYLNSQRLDRFNNIGINFSNLICEDKESALLILREEFLPN